MDKSSIVAEIQTGNIEISLWQHFREDIACVFERDPAARNKWEVITTYPGVHAVIIYRLTHQSTLR